MKSQSIIVFIVLLLTALFLPTGFDDIIRGRTEIENLYPIVLAGVDKNDDPEEPYLVTTVSPTTEEEAEKTNNIMIAAGKTLFEANRIIGMYAENDIFWGHTKYLFIGEEASKEDINQYLDFFMRDNEPRRTMIPIIVKGRSSEEVISLLYEQNIDISSNIETVVQNASLTSYYSSLNLLEYYNLSAESGDGYLPYIILENENKHLRMEQGSEEVEKGQYEEIEQTGVSKEDVIMHIPGYALIKDGKVVDYISHEKARGLNWIINKIISGVIVVHHEGVMYNLEITHGHSKIEPKIEGNHLGADIKINVDTIITEMNQQGVTIDDELIKALNKKLGEEVEKEAKEAIEIAQKNKIDVLGLGTKFNLKHPVKWQKEYKEQWEELFPNVEIKVTAEPTVERSAIFNYSIMEDGK